jgi:hypothetical protein
VLGAANRRIGGILALAAELWLRLGRPIEAGQSLYRSARWVDRTTYDVEALAREGNLAVLPLDETSREIVAEWVETGAAELLDRLLEDYVAPEEPAGAEETRRIPNAETP